jgi:Tfp pilus assembly protein PilF
MAAGEYEEAVRLRRAVVTGLRGCLPSEHHKDAAKAIRALSEALAASGQDADEVGQTTFQATGIEDALATAAKTAAAGFLRAAHDAEARGDHREAEAAFRRAVKYGKSFPYNYIRWNCRRELD